LEITGKKGGKESGELGMVWIKIWRREHVGKRAVHPDAENEKQSKFESGLDMDNKREDLWEN
jgi:hypothetical protein